MLLYQLSVTLILTLLFCIAVWNYFSFAAIRQNERPSQTPRVSVLVPARNEERTITACVRSLLAQNYPDFEVCVLNDASDDATGSILAKLAAEHPELRVLTGTPLPAGWVGKNWACHQLALLADGEWLIFTDADTVHSPESIAACIAFTERTGVEFLSGVPHQRLRGFWERAVVPMVIFLYFAYLPNKWITNRRDPKFSATNGQLLCMTRRAYAGIGGHEAVRSQLVEDVWLGRAAKRRGLRTALATAVETVECRMYRTPTEVLSGFSKNFFPGFDYSLTGLGFFIASALLLYTAPAIFAAAAIASRSYTFVLFWLPLIQLVLAAVMRAMLAIRFRMGAEQALLHPISAIAISLIAVNSVRWAYSRRGASWKGRSYGRVK
ncbi:MAG: glycosyltransferase [Bacteroidetes bacterium]|nr:glycosyltransferase [Bacteroidota bacterium]